MFFQQTLPSPSPPFDPLPPQSSISVGYLGTFGRCQNSETNQIKYFCLCFALSQSVFGFNAFSKWTLRSEYGFHFFVVTQKSRIIVIIIISCSAFIESRTRNCTKAMLPHIHKLISIRVLSTNGIRDDNFEYLNMPPPTTKLYLFIPNTHTQLLMPMMLVWLLLLVMMMMMGRSK